LLKFIEKVFLNLLDEFSAPSLDGRFLQGKPPLLSHAGLGPEG